MRLMRTKSFMTIPTIAIAVIFFSLSPVLSFGQKPKPKPKPTIAEQKTADKTPDKTPDKSPDKSPEFKPSEQEQKDGRILQLEATNSLKDWQADAVKLPSYQTYDHNVNMLRAWCVQMIKQHQQEWGPDMDCNMNQNPILFYKTTAAAAAPAAAPKQ